MLHFRRDISYNVGITPVFNPRDNSPSFEYYKRNKTVKYLIEQKGLDFDSLLDYAKQHNEKEAWKETAQWLKKNVLR